MSDLFEEETPIYTSAKNGYLNELKLLLKDAQFDDLREAFKGAFNSGKIFIIEYLLKTYGQYDDILKDFFDHNNNNREAVLEYLVRRISNVDTIPVIGMSLLSYAIMYKYNDDFIEYLINERFDVDDLINNMEVLLACVKAHNNELFHRFVQKDQLSKKDVDTIIITALSYDNYHILNYMKEYIADVPDIVKKLNSMIARKFNDVASVKELRDIIILILRQGVIPDANTLLLAYNLNDEQLIKMIEDLNPVIDKFPTFVEAIIRGDIDTVKRYVEEGIDVSRDDNIAIRRAFQNYHLDIVDYLAQFVPTVYVDRLPHWYKFEDILYDNTGITISDNDIKVDLTREEDEILDNLIKSGRDRLAYAMKTVFTKVLYWFDGTEDEYEDIIVAVLQYIPERDRAKANEIFDRIRFGEVEEP